MDGMTFTTIKTQQQKLNVLQQPIDSCFPLYFSRMARTSLSTLRWKLWRAVFLSIRRVFQTNRLCRFHEGWQNTSDAAYVRFQRRKHTVCVNYSECTRHTRKLLARKNGLELILHTSIDSSENELFLKTLQQPFFTNNIHPPKLDVLDTMFIFYLLLSKDHS